MNNVQLNNSEITDYLDLHGSEHPGLIYSTFVDIIGVITTMDNAQ